MAMDTCNLFEEDEVFMYSKGKGYTFGLVLENYEFISSDEEEDDNEEERLQKGTVRVAWHPSGKESVMAENKVLLVDRSLMPGDVVRRPILGRDSQCGYVTNMEVKAHLRVLRSNKFIYNINSTELVPIVPFESGQEVIFDAWWGRVENVISELILTFPDGARCRVDEADLVMYDDVTEKQREGEFGMGPHYPGQELKGPLYCLGEAKWIHSTPRYSHRVANRIGKTSLVSVSIEKVETKSVEVQWIFGSEHTSPPRIVTGDDLSKLQVLDWFSHCSLQIGDRMMYRVKNDDAVVSTPPSQAFCPREALNKNIGVQVAREESNKATSEDQHRPAEETALAAAAVSAVDNGEDDNFEDVEDEEETDSNDEKPGGQGGKMSGLRGGRKKAKGSYKNRLKASKQKGGAKRRGVKAIERIVRPDTLVEVETELTTSWANVLWQDGTLERDIPSRELFPLHHLDEHEFFPGDFVLPKKDIPDTTCYGVVCKADHSERTCTVHWCKVYEVGKDTKPAMVEANCEVSVYDIKDHTHFKFRPGQSVATLGGSEDGDSGSQAVGQICELDGNGHLIVKWADGTISQRYPQEVFIISREDESDSDGWDTESDYESDASSAETWETESEQEIIEQEEEAKTEREDSGYDQDAISEHRQELDSLLGRAQTALERLQKLLNTFDVTVQAPDCFHDILRIFRSCHDLDRILKSGFFRDAELRSFIGQVKQELKREKANKFTKHLSQVFESWSQNISSLSGSSRSFGLVGADGQMVKFSAGRGSRVEVALDLSSSEEGAAGGDEGLSQWTSTDSAGFEALGLKKEFSEPAISKRLVDHETLTERRPSDSAVSTVGCLPPPRSNSEEPNLVGENCVAKASKRVSSEDCDDSSTDAKKCKEDKKCSSQQAQELCLKICQNLQKQILLIHAEMNKRTAKLLQASENAAETKGDSVNSEAISEKAPEVISGGESREPSSEAVEAVEAKAEVKAESTETKEDSEPNTQTEQHTEASVEETEEVSDWAHLKVPCKGFEMLSEVPPCHKFANHRHHESQPSNPRSFRSAVRKELSLFQSSLPDGIFVKGYENRLDLFSVMVLGPEGTPYEDAVFLFDLMLPKDYPSSPPVCHYHSNCNGRLNPNLYEDGKVCVSLLGTWSGKGTEVWTSKSNLLQVLVSFQGLILVPEPYYNEAGFDRQRGTQVGEDNSRMYNEMAVLRTVQSLAALSDNPPSVFVKEISTYLLAHGPRMINRLRQWVELSQSLCQEASSTDSGIASSPLPASGTEPQPLSLDQEMCPGQPEPSTPDRQPPTNNTDFDAQPGSGSQSQVSEAASNADSPAGLLPEPQLSAASVSGQEPSKVSQVSSQMESLSLLPNGQASKSCGPQSMLTAQKPEYPLFPMSKGFRLTLRKVLTQYETSLQNLGKVQEST